MLAFPLVWHAHLSDVVATRRFSAANPQRITVARFVADVAQLVAVLPAGRHVLNACADRYHFAVGLAAAMVAGKTSLLPSTHTPEMVRQMQVFAPDVFCLSDGPCTIDLPQFAYPAVWAAPDAPVAAVPQIPADQTVAFVFTSGSTGLPLPHRKTWGALVRNVRAEAERLGLLERPGGAVHSIVGTVPPQHMYGFESTVLVAMQSGSVFSADHPFYPADICSALAQVDRPRVLVTTPVHLRALLDAGLEIPALDLVVSATAPLSPQLAQAAEAALQMPLLEIYGSTETGQVATRRTALGAEWQLFPGVQLTAQDGGTWVSGGHVEQAVPMGDVLEPLSATHFLLHGRIADLVNIAGKRSSLAYLNHQLNAIEGVQDGAFYMPEDRDRDGVTRLMAFVVAPGWTQAALLTALRERIDPIFLPRPLLLLDQLPRNSTGKLPREALQALAHNLQRPPHAV
ncbi:MAG: AMP-binding protein [Rhodoferax sp.]|uniref:AMP-binding protein n=1 Tax=Rhodoferax sp. TaxID=50421 RepID=UPI003264254F